MFILPKQVHNFFQATVSVVECWCLYRSGLGSSVGRSVLNEIPTI